MLPDKHRTTVRCLWVAFLLLVATSSLLFVSTPLAAQDVTPPRPQDNEALTAALAQDNARIAYHTQTGKVRFIGAANLDQAIRQPSVLPLQASQEDAARRFLTAYGPLFGLTDQSRELVPESLKTADGGRNFTRFQQVYNGIPVVGGELIVQTDSRNDVLSANGEILPDIAVSTSPTISAAAARQTALGLVAKWYEVEASGLTVSEPELWIYNPALIKPEKGETRLVWRMEVKPVDLAPIWELILIDAQRGSVALHFNQIDTAKIRRTYTANNGYSLPGTPVCSDPAPCTSSDPHVLAAHQYAGDTYDFYFTNHGRDSINNAGMAIISTVHYGYDYDNAFWNGSQMVYGDASGYPLADDVVAHELTHGVTQYESNLFYYYQSGAINEAFSDIWGEFVDQTNLHGTDTPAVKWLMGEDITGLGAIRSMSNPPAYGDPDQMTSSYYYTGTSDNGGVHTNSGVGAKAAYLMVDGGTFNGQTVTGLGITKTAKIFYEVQTNLLTSGGDYGDLYDLLYQACLGLVGTSGITASDCQEVRDATNAVEMNQQPVADFNTEAPMCPTGQLVEAVLFSDNMESGSSNWTFARLVGTSRWRYDSPYGGYAHSGLHFLYADDYPDTVSDSYAAMKTSVSLLEGTYLHFAHAYGFEGSSYDGGVLEYSTNNGASWNDAGGLIEENPYDGVISSCCDNPLGDRSGFRADSHGYLSSRVNLSSLEGQSVRFRWRMGLDYSGYDWGWWLDDVQIYTCASLPAPSNLQATAVSFREVGLTWVDQSADETEFRIERSTNETTGWGQIDTVAPNVTSYSDNSVTCGVKYYYRVRAYRSGDSELSHYLNTVSVTPPCSPSSAAPQRNYYTTDTPTLTWNRVSDTTEYEVQVDTATNFALPLIFTTTVPATTLEVTLPSLPDGLYYWRVRAKSGTTTGAWSAVDSFIVDVP